MRSGITRVFASAICVLAVVWVDPAPRLELPRGFTASLYARGIAGARDLDVRPDGTLTLQGRDDRFEIAPPTADAPVTVMRVAAELDLPNAAEVAALAVQAPRFVRLSWNADSGELAYHVEPDGGARVAIPPRTLSLARRLAHRRHADVAMAPDGTLYFADSRAGAVWLIRPASL